MNWVSVSVRLPVAEYPPPPMVKAGAKRLVFVGSLAATGPSIGGVPRTEDDEFNPQEWYGESKVEAERISFRYADRLEVTCCRPARIVGPGDHENLTFFKLVKKGVILRIDSPGGSAVASEVMWQGISRLAKTRPVWVSVGGMAASGGYYVASAGSRVYVNPSSIVGSIGVVGGKVNMEGLYEKLKVNVVSRSRGPMAGMFRTTGSWTPEELSAVRSKMTETYELFTKRVVAGRTGIDLKQTAEGRLFTGNQAITNRMADKIGGLDTAVRELASELKLTDYSVMEFPGPKSLGDVLKDSLGGFVSAPGGVHAAAARPSVTPEIAAAIRLTVGPKALPKFEQAIAGFEALRNEHVILMSPSLMVFR
jgi:protease-4